MIWRRATAADIRLLTVTNETAGRIASLMDAYGSGVPFVDFWTDSDGSFCAVINGVAFLVVTEAGRADAFLLLSMQPAVHTVHTDPETAVHLKAACPGAIIRTGEIMRFSGQREAGGSLPDISPRFVYPLLATYFPTAMPPFDDWYVDMSHRLRHGNAHLAVQQEENTVISSAMTLAEWETGALLGGVVTHPHFRKRGLAGACITALLHALPETKKDIYICPLTPTARRLYESLGFTVADHWAEVDKGETNGYSVF